jgi:hypothetical protein
MYKDVHIAAGSQFLVLVFFSEVESSWIDLDVHSLVAM